MHKFTSKLVRYFSSGLKNNILAQLELKNDKYNAIHITPKEQLEGKQFNEYMSSLLTQSSTNGTTSIWVHLQGPQLSLLSDLINVHSFTLHRGAEKSISLYKWILKERKDMVVPYSLFHVGCGGVVINDNSILLIEQKRGELKGRYGIPGGRADFGEGVQQCSEREVWEEVGIKTKFQNILWLRELSSYVYGSFDFYFACLMSATPEQLKNLKVCDYQVEKAIWVPLKEYRAFAAENSFGTQLQVANYIHTLYESGYDFTKHRNNYSSKRYQSIIDQKQRFFGQHRLAEY